MSTVEAIETAIQNLAPDELARFRDWFIQFDADAWDERGRRITARGKDDGAWYATRCAPNPPYEPLAKHQL